MQIKYVTIPNIFIQVIWFLASLCFLYLFLWTTTMYHFFLKILNSEFLPLITENITCCSQNFQPCTSGLYPPLGIGINPIVAHFISSSQEIAVHDLWKGQNCHIADKCIDSTFTWNIVQTSLPHFRYTRPVL